MSALRRRIVRNSGYTDPRWEALVPRSVALDQTRWERERMAIRARDVCGLTFAELGEALGGVGKERARQLYERAKRYEGFQSPVERYLGGLVSDLQDIVTFKPINRRPPRMPSSAGITAGLVM